MLLTPLYPNLENTIKSLSILIVKMLRCRRKCLGVVEMSRNVKGLINALTTSLPTFLRTPEKLNFKKFFRYNICLLLDCLYKRGPRADFVHKFILLSCKIEVFQSKIRFKPSYDLFLIKTGANGRGRKRVMA